MKSIEEQISKVLSEEFMLRPESLSADTTFDTLGFDSLVIVELALILNRKFKVAIKDGELIETMTITDTAALIAAKAAMSR